MPGKRFDPAAAMAAINKRFPGAVVLRPGSKGTGKNLVRNRITDRVLPCHYAPCWEDGDTRYELLVPMEEPGWRDPATGREQRYAFVFCSDLHRRLYAVGTEYEKFL